MIVSTNAYTVSTDQQSGGYMILMYDVDELVSALNSPANEGKYFFYAGETATVDGELYPHNSMYQVLDENSAPPNSGGSHSGGGDTQ